MNYCPKWFHKAKFVRISIFECTSLCNSEKRNLSVSSGATFWQLLGNFRATFWQLSYIYLLKFGFPKVYVARIIIWLLSIGGR